MSKRITGIIISFLMAVAMLVGIPQLTAPVYADEGDPGMEQGYSLLTKNAGDTGLQKVWYGDRAWYVIAADDTASTATLLQVEVKEKTRFNADDQQPYSNAYGWMDSDEETPQTPSNLRSFIESRYVTGYQDGDNTVAPYISEQEQLAIVSRTLEGGSGNYFDDDYDSNKIRGKEVRDAYVWPLSVAEAEVLPESVRTTGEYWWLRSPGEDTISVAEVYEEGHVIMSGYYVDSYDSVRPAFYLNLESVLFTSAAEGGKSCTEGALTQIGTNSSNEWKVTLKDKAHADFAVNTCAVTYDSSTGALTVPYSGVKTAGDNEYISAIVKNSQGEITYYGRIAKASTADDASVTINTSGKVGDGDKLYVFSEQFNGDKTGETGAKTDYASDLQEVPLANGSHDWEFKGFEWTGDETNGYTKAVANYVCENDSTHTDTVDATVTEAVTEPTTTTTGKTTYSATVPSDKSLDGQPHDATNTENAEKEAKVTDMIVYTFTEGDGSTWTKGSSDNLDVTVKRSVDDDTTFARCQKITVDGKTELTDADCTKAEGSLKLSLKPSFLETLSEGKHTLVVTFDDGDSPEMTFTIEAKAEEETKPDTSPTTGDHNNAGLWAAIMGGALLAVILLVLLGRKYLKKQR